MADPSPPPNPPPAAAVPGPLDDPALRSFLQQSPTLRAGIAQLGADRFQVVWGPPGSGTFLDAANSRLVIQPDFRGNGGQIAGSLAHEIGHHQFREPLDTSSREAYVRSQLRGEAVATLNEARVRQEIVSNGGPDIGLPGTGDRPRQYQTIAGELAGGTITREQAIQRIAEVFKTEHPSGSPPGQTYEQYYGNWYDQNYGARTRAPNTPAPDRADPSAQAPTPGQPGDPLYAALRDRFPATMSNDQVMHATVLAKEQGITADRMQTYVQDGNAWVAATFPPGVRVQVNLAEPAPSMAESLQKSQTLDVAQQQRDLTQQQQRTQEPAGLSR